MSVAHLTYETVSARIAYDTISGHLTWKDGPRCGLRAGSIQVNGRRALSIGGRHIMEHRIAWLLMTGEWPSKDLDHKNRDPADNRWANLRLATRQENRWNIPRMANNKSGFKGVHWSRYARRWRAQITTAGVRHDLGYFDTAEGAALAYEKVASVQHGEFHHIAVSQ